MASSNYDTDYTKLFKTNNLRYGQSYMDFDKMIKNYNLSRLPDYDNAAEPYIGYILMSAPSLNVADNRNQADSLAYANLSALKENSMTSAFVNDVYGKKLLMTLTEGSSNRWLPIITTKAMSYTVNDVELKTVDKGNTYYGHVLKYAKHSEEHKISSTFSIDFRNDRYLSILKMMYIWMTYMYLVSKTDVVQPSWYNQKNGILDYAASIYYLVARRDGRELVYWEKSIGVFPIRVPMSMFSYSDNMITEDRVQIDFSYGIKSDPCDPSILMDINTLSGYSFNSIKQKTVTSSTNLAKTLYYENNKEVPFVKGDVLASRPFIKMVKGFSGELKYYLTWEQ